MAQENILGVASSVWADIRGQLEDKPPDLEEPPSDVCHVPHDEVRKVAKAYQQAVTKFGTVATATKSTEDPALRAAGEEVMAAFSEAVNILVALRRGACAPLREELRDTGSVLAAATEHLGAAVGSADLPICQGNALLGAIGLERISAHNRAATRRRILIGLGQLRDANRELSAALGIDHPEPGSPGLTPSPGLEKKELKSPRGEETDSDLADIDREDLDPHTKRLVESVQAAVLLLEDTLKWASQACMPSADVGSPSASLSELEAAAQAAAAASQAVEGLASNSVGGLDRGEFAKSLEDLRGAASALGGIFDPEVPAQLRTRLDTIQEALDATPADV